jgi:hypothetical protein
MLTPRAAARKRNGIAKPVSRRNVPVQNQPQEPCFRATRDIMDEYSKTALNADEWQDLRASRARLEIWDDPRPGSGMLGVEDQGEDASKGYARVPSEARHALAALALYDQPFGFTWEDVDRLREAVHDIDFSHVEDVEQRRLMELDTRMMRAWMLDLADRIADLLPPRANAFR